MQSKRHVGNTPDGDTSTASSCKAQSVRVGSGTRHELQEQNSHAPPTARTCVSSRERDISCVPGSAKLVRLRHSQLPNFYER